MPVELCLANMSEFQGTKIVVDLTIASIANVLAQTIGSPIQSVLLERNIIQAGKTANESMTIGGNSGSIKRLLVEPSEGFGLKDSDIYGEATSSVSSRMHPIKVFASAQRIISVTG